MIGRSREVSRSGASTWSARRRLLPEHDHGPSHVLLFPLHGRVQLHHDGANHDLRPGTATHIGIGEPVSSPNPGPDHAELVVVAASPDFA